jgi:hypothetical protein
VPLSNLLAVVSAGWALVLAGALLASAGIAVGINQAVPTVPLWLCLLGMGAAVSGAGWFLVSRGGEKASEKVDAEWPLASQIVKHPLVAALLAALLAFVISRLFRIGTSAAPAAAKAAAPPPVQPVAPAQTEEAPEPPKEKDFGSFISDQAKTLGMMASEAALTIGLQSMGIPTVEELFREFTKGTVKTSEEPNQPDGGFSAEAEATRHNGYHKEAVRMG